MGTRRWLDLAAAATACAVFVAVTFAQEPALPSLADVTRQASHQTTIAARTVLEPATSSLFQSADLIEPDRVPNFIRALSLIPRSAAPYGSAFKALLYGGSVDPETKMAMGLEIGRVLRSPYVVVHTHRLLSATDKGRLLVRHLESGSAIRPEQRLALEYAHHLTRDVHGIDDERFRQVRGYYTDPQIVELTMTVSYFNYFTRFVQAVNVPVESWALDGVAHTPTATRDRSLARVGLISDAHMEWAAGVVAQRNRASAKPAEGGLGLGIVNSQRAMNLVPDITAAWRAYTGSLGSDAAVSQEIKLQISFAVSTSNGCRYCTLHQVLGLRRLGVSPEKLLQMQKDDSALTPRELVAVKFARQLTRDPSSVTDRDYERIRTEFGERGALEVVLQTCNFAFMNRFTDNLGLPSEDEAIRVYREVYGGDWK
jgi:AhpD family alkylhydroperoxidase